MAGALHEPAGGAFGFAVGFGLGFAVGFGVALIVGVGDGVAVCVGVGLGVAFGVAITGDGPTRGWLLEGDADTAATGWLEFWTGAAAHADEIKATTIIKAIRPHLMDRRNCDRACTTRA